MKKSIYSRFSTEKLELRDYLALERTILSNERTLLSYSQNGLAFVVTGITASYAVDSRLINTGGYLLIAIGLTIAVIGVIRFFRVKGRLDLASPAQTADVAANQLSSAQSERNKETT